MIRSSMAETWPLYVACGLAGAVAFGLAVWLPDLLPYVLAVPFLIYGTVRGLANPYLLVGAYWAAYSVFTTIVPTYVPDLLAGAAGAFYIFYLLMAFTVIWAFARKREFKWPSVAYVVLAFVLLAAASLLWQPPGLSVASYQRVFTYALSLLVMLQFRGEESRERMLRNVG